MIEREPDYEDGKIRAWTFGEGRREGEEFEGDPTVMSLDVEKEEIFESRTYRFWPGPEGLAYVIDLVASREPKLALRLSPEDVIRIARKLMEDTTFKVLAKRRKEDGCINSLLVAVGPHGRHLLARQEWAGETEYREAVQDFEGSLLAKRILIPGLVVTAEEWRRYSEEGPFSEVSPGQHR